MARAHVVDDAVVDRLVKVRGQAARPTPSDRNDPQALQQADVQAVRRDERDHVAPGRPDRRAQIEAAAETDEIRVEVDKVKMQLALQVGAELRVTGDHQSRPVGRPVEVADVPGPVGQLLDLPACGGHDEQVVHAAVDVAASVVLVIEPAHHASDRRATKLIAILGRPRVVHHGAGVREHRSEERDSLAVR